MTLLTCAALAILFSLSNQEILASTQNTLKKQVQESMEDVEWEDGSFDLDSDFYDLDGGVYLSLYTETGELLYGRIPYGFDLKPDFSDGQPAVSGTCLTLPTGFPAMDSSISAEFPLSQRRNPVSGSRSVSP